MRIAAGILMIILGGLLLFLFTMVLLEFGIDVHSIYRIPFMICSAFLITGGVFCLTRQYWRLCFASALVAVFIGIYWLIGSLYASAATGFTWVVSILGTPPIVFVCLRKSEWQEISG